ncbi:short-chain dehydrogenase/reductase SDR [Colletotrichum karsti]|uniref:Short-chain dehydrogenase/reductase SDR n=1 Tax=Colletotrichum karsti TaxID=1095194 RepID=A0A9P6I1S2_9PEZI|nr:short-chain dehydrogenase/reductase SDR [Colletotrichum karsti]KAF9874654.1 short-chain dehydrogenase/reductase SDR [Colletotrichum karsti]
MALDTLPVLVIIGGGGIGLATALRLGKGHHILLASRSQSTLAGASEALKQAGHKFTTQQVDVADYASVAAVAETAASLGGAIGTVVLTSAISPSMGSSKKIMEVDVLGTANAIAAFGNEVEMPRGSSFVCVGSMAQHMSPPLSPELETHLATAPLDKLLTNDELWELALTHEGAAYCVAKRANVLRVQAAAASEAFAGKGVRVNCVSPGTTDTKMLREEMAGGSGDGIRAMIEALPVKRAGTADEMAEGVEFVSRCGYINGTDVLIDGGCMAAQRWGATAPGPREFGGNWKF